MAINYRMLFYTNVDTPNTNHLSATSLKLRSHMRGAVAERRRADFDTPAPPPRVCSHIRGADAGESAISWGQNMVGARGFEADAENWVLDPMVAEHFECFVVSAGIVNNYNYTIKEDSGYITFCLVTFSQNHNVSWSTVESHSQFHSVIVQVMRSCNGCFDASVYMLLKKLSSYW